MSVIINGFEQYAYPVLAFNLYTQLHNEVTGCCGVVVKIWTKPGTVQRSAVTNLFVDCKLEYSSHDLHRSMGAIIGSINSKCEGRAVAMYMGESEDRQSLFVHVYMSFNYC
jgi:hypothetical protein